MKPLTVRPLTDAERAELRLGLRSPDAFTLRRCQYLLAAAAGHAAAGVAATYGGSRQGVRNALRAFAARGTACLRRTPSANTTPRRAWPRDRDGDLKALLHRPPRDFGKPTGLWTLALLAAPCHEQGWTVRALSGEAIRQALTRLGVSWRRAKHWLSSPDPEYAAKKSARRPDRRGGRQVRLGAGVERTSAGGPAWRSRACRRGPGATRCGWGRRTATRVRRRSGRRWPATGCCGPTPAG